MFFLKLLRIRIFSVRCYPIFDGLSQYCLNVSLGDARYHLTLLLLSVSLDLLCAFNRLESFLSFNFVNWSKPIPLERGDSESELLLKVSFLNEVCELEEAKSFASFLGDTF